MLKGGGLVGVCGCVHIRVLKHDRLTRGIVSEVKPGMDLEVVNQSGEVIDTPSSQNFGTCWTECVQGVHEGRSADACVVNAVCAQAKMELVCQEREGGDTSG